MLIIHSQLHTQKYNLHNHKKDTLYDTVYLFVKRSKEQVKEIILPFVLQIHNIHVEDHTDIYVHVML